MTPDELEQIKQRWLTPPDFPMWTHQAADVVALVEELETQQKAYGAALRRAFGAECQVKHLERQLAEKEKDRLDWKERWLLAHAQVQRWFNLALKRDTP